MKAAPKKAGAGKAPGKVSGKPQGKPQGKTAGKPFGKKVAAKKQVAKKAAAREVEVAPPPARDQAPPAAAASQPPGLPPSLPPGLPKKLGSKTLTRLAPLIASMVAPTASDAAVLDRLFAVITERRDADPTTSHSARLLARGMPKVAQKFGEEAVECLIEAVGGNQAELVAESADVLYHLLVLWVAAGVTPAAVWAELARREGVSGIAEKAARARPLGTTKIP